MDALGLESRRGRIKSTIKGGLGSVWNNLTKVRDCLVGQNPYVQIRVFRGYFAYLGYDGGTSLNTRMTRGGGRVSVINELV